ncbi:hypothetical protein IQ37_13175 [Chryseobacterium piperi]|uniref:Lipoprotein n=1 Tax=Chryseobacterium piperi TaxID=558152 RepID=A0A086B715_9FLAO|nr:hypothetical protein [Chryseobacterium piperi]ASW76202.1 hypothetical protein CJF12_19285 [Chryseobacterium piperi]KFF24729.1 hypothetical protein IQ37_13175 [Chryseobacterium piperi]
MKKFILAVTIVPLVISCNKIGEKIDQTVQKTTETVQQKAQAAVEERVKNTVNESIKSLTNSQDIQFNDVFPNSGKDLISAESGKKFVFPNGTEGYIFKYKADKETLIPFLEGQATTNESKSDQKARKINGQSIIDKISFIEKFLPENTIDKNILEDIKNDDGIEYYKLKRFPNSSTIIYNSKNKTVLQYVEVNK